MKNKEAYLRYIRSVDENEYLADNIELWEACEEHYESRRCDVCKYYWGSEGLCSGGHDIIDSRVPEDFSCKYWEKKK